jgi:Skp family chaperone for outer membrane proteins
MPTDEKVAELLARRAEADAQRWEAAAVEMEKQRNKALRDASAARAEVAEMRKQVEAQALQMIGILDETAGQVAAAFQVQLPSRGCMDIDDDRY